MIVAKTKDNHRLVSPGTLVHSSSGASRVAPSLFRDVLAKAQLRLGQSRFKGLQRFQSQLGRRKVLITAKPTPAGPSIVTRAVIIDPIKVQAGGPLPTPQSELTQFNLDAKIVWHHVPAKFKLDASNNIALEVPPGFTNANGIYLVERPAKIDPTGATPSSGPNVPVYIGITITTFAHRWRPRLASFRELRLSEFLLRRTSAGIAGPMSQYKVYLGQVVSPHQGIQKQTYYQRIESVLIRSVLRKKFSITNRKQLDKVQPKNPGTTAIRIENVVRNAQGQDDRTIMPYLTRNITVSKAEYEVMLNEAIFNESTLGESVFG